MLAAVLVCCGSASPASAQAPGGKWTCQITRNEHPRIWITPERLTTMREHMRKDTPEWQMVGRVADRAPDGKFLAGVT